MGISVKRAMSIGRVIHHQHAGAPETGVSSTTNGYANFTRMKPPLYCDPLTLRHRRARSRSVEIGRKCLLILVITLRDSDGL